MEQSKNRNKAVIAAVLAACLAVAAIIGTIAWLTSTSTATNTFIVGSITPPTTDPDNPSNPVDASKLTGNILEKNWVDKSTAAPGVTVSKDPNIGLGKGSEDSYVFVYVKNDLTTASAGADKQAYFTLETGWAPVAGHVTASTATGASPNSYTGGLFMYVGAGSTAQVVASSHAANDLWTGALFNQVMVPAATTSDLFTTMPNSATIAVSCYIHASNNTTASDASDAAIAWAGTLV